jgi:hypothetical protein
MQQGHLRKPKGSLGCQALPINMGTFLQQISIMEIEYFFGKEGQGQEEQEDECSICGKSLSINELHEAVCTNCKLLMGGTVDNGN